MEFGTSQKAVKRPHLTLSLPCLFWSAAKPGNVCRTSGFHFQRKFGQLEYGTFVHLARWVWAALLVNVTGSQWGNLPLVPSPLPGLKGEKILRTKVCLVCSTLSRRRRCPRKPGIKSASRRRSAANFCPISTKKGVYGEK